MLRDASLNAVVIYRGWLFVRAVLSLFTLHIFTYNTWSVIMDNRLPLSRRHLLAASAAGAVLTGASVANAATFGNPDEPPEGAVNVVHGLTASCGHLCSILVLCLLGTGPAVDDQPVTAFGEDQRGRRSDAPAGCGDSRNW